MRRIITFDPVRPMPGFKLIHKTDLRLMRAVVRAADAYVERRRVREDYSPWGYLLHTLRAFDKGERK